MSQNNTDSHRLVAYLESTESRVFEIVIHLCVEFRVANLVWMLLHIRIHMDSNEQVDPYFHMS